MNTTYKVTFQVPKAESREKAQGLFRGVCGSKYNSRISTLICDGAPFQLHLTAKQFISFFILRRSMCLYSTVRWDHVECIEDTQSCPSFDVRTEYN